MNRLVLSSCVVASLVFAQAKDAGVAAKPAAPPKPAAAVTFAEGIATPESVLYDAETDTYLVSNINGAPLDKDNNGYIAELSPDGKTVNAKLIEGGKNKVTLNAPKGSALVGGVLYVADIDTVRMFDRKTGAPKGEIALKGATFANDVAGGPDWGWRTEVQLNGNELIITAYNILPDGQEAKATELSLTKTTP